MANSSKKAAVRLHNAIQRLTRKRAYFAQFSNFNDWIETETSQGNDAAVDSELPFFKDIYDHVMASFWRQQIFVSPSFVELVIFDALLNANASNLLAYINSAIKASGLTRDSVVIFPLHSFGFASRDFQIYRRRHPAYAGGENFRLYSQSNSLDTTIDNIFNYLDAIKLPNRSKLDAETIRHYHRSRSMKWLEANPILISKFRFSQWPLRDNVSVIREQITFVATKVFFMKALLDARGLAIGKYPPFSTRNINNFQTLDIRHFLTVATAKGSAEFLSIPIHARNTFIFDDTNLNFVLDMDAHKGFRWGKRVFRAVDIVRAGAIQFRAAKSAEFAKYAMLSNSLKYFRRAVRAYNAEDRAVDLNTAFEIILLDKNDSNKHGRILDRSWSALRRTKIATMKALQEQLGDLISERNAVIHNGHRVTKSLDFTTLFHAYARLFLKVADDIASIDSRKANYMGHYFDSL